MSVKDKHGVQQLHLVDTETTTDRPFGSRLHGPDRIAQLSVHPDGKRVAFSRGRLIQEIWTMKNVLPEEKQSAAK